MPSRTSLMPARPILRLAAGLYALGLAVGPASAQLANPLDWFFGKSSSEKPAAQPAAPEPAARTAQPAAGKAVLPPRRPASLGNEQAQTAPASQPASAPIPPGQRQAAPQPAAPPVVTAAAAV